MGVGTSALIFGGSYAASSCHEWWALSGSAVLAILYLIAGSLTALAGIAFAVYLLAETRFGNNLDRIFMALGVLTLSFYLVISVFAVAEIIKLVIDIEHNTRMAAVGTRQMGVAQAMSASADAGTPAMATRDGGRWSALDEETAEGAPLRGH